MARWLRRHVPAATGSGLELPPTEVPPLRPMSEPERPAVAAVILGLEGEAFRAVVDMVAAQQEALGARPVFLVDQLDFSPIRAHRAAFEYLPPPEDRARFAPDLNWQLYSRRRYVMFLLKYRPISVVGFGPEVAARLGPLELTELERAEG